MKSIPLVYMGSPAVAVTILQGLIESGHEIRAVITQPDKPAGRGQKLHPPPVKEFAVSRGFPVLQPAKLKDPDLYETLQKLNPQAIVVAAYGKLIPNEILEMAPWGCLNVHFSLLPQYRGASCVASAIRNGEKEAGVTIMRITEKLDAGPILSQEKVAIDPEESTGELEGRLALIGTRLMLQGLQDLESGTITPREQEETAVTYAPLLKKGEGRIDWGQTAQKIHDQIRAFNPWPAAFTYVDKMRVKVYGSRVFGSQESRIESQEDFGKIVGLGPEGITTACGKGLLLITEVQPESKRKMNAWDFAQGHREWVKMGNRFL